MSKAGLVVAGFAAVSMAAMAWLFLAPGDDPPAAGGAAAEAEAEAPAPEPAPARAARPAAVELAAPVSAAAAPAGPPALNCRAASGAVLRLGSEEVSAEEFCRELVAIAGAQPDPVGDGWRQQARQLRQQVIDARLVRQALSAEGATISAQEIDTALGERLSDPAQAGRAKLDAAATALVREQLRQRLELTRLLQLRGQARIDDAALLAAYQADPARFGEPAVAVALPFLWRLPRSVGEPEAQQARAKAEQFVRAVQGGAAAESALKDTGGQAMPKTELVQGSGETELLTAALQLAAKQWSAPVRTGVGWAVVQVLEVRPAQVLPFDKVRERVRTFVLGRQGLEDRQRLLTELRAAAKVVDLVVF